MNDEQLVETIRRQTAASSTVNKHLLRGKASAPAYS
jgi:hypothetical protein